MKKFIGKSKVDFRVDRKGEFAQVTFAWLPSVAHENYWVRGAADEVLSELKTWIEDNEYDIKDYSLMSDEDAGESNFYGADYWEDKCREKRFENVTLQMAVDNLQKLMQLGNCRVRV